MGNLLFITGIILLIVAVLVAFLDDRINYGWEIIRVLAVSSVALCVIGSILIYFNN